MTGAVEALEREFAARLGIAGAVATGFGRSALALALGALHVRGGDVLVPDFICAQVPEAVRCAGAVPVSYPVRRDLSVGADAFRAAFTPRTRAAILAHYFGRLLPAREQFAALCRAQGAALVEDCALALGALADGQAIAGDLAVFSFTKSDWCYGGGIVVSNRVAFLAESRALRAASFRHSRKLAFWYGVLRRVDFAANLPRWGRLSEWVGPRLERMSGISDGNFYDAGQFDLAMSPLTARRALRILAELPRETARRREILKRLTDSLRQAGLPLLRCEVEPGDAGTFLLLACPSGCAERWRAQAASEGITLRRAWLAYQKIEGAPRSAELDWLAERLLVLEIHPGLSANEVARLGRAIERLAASGVAGPQRSVL